MGQQGAFPYPNGTRGYYPQYQVQSYPVQDPNQPVALVNALPVNDPDQPVLIKKFGAEVVPISGGKVKITGIMGNSWDPAGRFKGGGYSAFV